MANSPFQDTVFVLQMLDALSPTSILDVGAGFGRWGFLCRCHLALGESLQFKPDQPLRIDAIEAYAPNISPLYDAVYNATHRGDAREVLPRLGMFDVIIFSHGLEHFAKEEGRRFLEEMKRHARMAVILGLPFDDPEREPPHANVYEAHLSTWTARDFTRGGALVREFPCGRGRKTGVVIVPTDDNACWHVRSLSNPLRAFGQRRAPGLMRRLAGWKKRMTDDG